MISPEIRNQHDHLGNADHLLEADDRAKINAGDWHRAGGDLLCDCGKKYYDHPQVIGCLSLNRLCNGELVHL